MIEQAVLIGLAAWRVTALIAYEDGPFDVFLRIRSIFKPKYENAGIPDFCVWCLGLWAAVGMYGIWQLEPTVVVVIAASAVLVAVEKWCHA